MDLAAERAAFVLLSFVITNGVASSWLGDA